jgi:NADH dehydrogenase
VRNDTQVTDIDRDGVTFRSEHDKAISRIHTKTVLWAGGVMPSDFARTLASRLGTEVDKAGRIKVNPDLTVPGHPDIYIVGDLALVSRQDGRPMPGVCQVAMQEGRHAARVIVSRLRGEKNPVPFRYLDRGDMAVIGRGSAVANIFGWHLSGLVAWLIWLFVHLMYLVEFQSRILVFIRWAFQYITFNRGSRLITGPVESEKPDA